MKPRAAAPDTRRLLLVLAIGLFVSGAGLIVIEQSTSAEAQPKDSPVLAAPVTTTTSSVVEPAAAPAPKPVAVPKDPYAAEPIQEIGTIEIPKIGLHHRAFHGITLRNIDKGPSHWPGSAMPGETGNTVWAGHRVTHSHPFRRIHELVPGDQVIFTVAGVRSVYVVTRHEIVTPKAVHIANPTPTPTGTLFACHPPGSAKYRYVVYLALLADG